MTFRGQGAFEYLLMLGGVVLIAVMVILMMQGSAQGADNTLLANQNSYHDIVTQGVKNTLTNAPKSAILSCTVGPATSAYISDNANCDAACKAAGYTGGTTVCYKSGCGASCNSCSTISCYGTTWHVITGCSAPGSCNMDTCNCTREETSVFSNVIIRDSFDTGPYPNPSLWTWGCQGSYGQGCNQTTLGGFLTVAAKASSYGAKSQSFVRSVAPIDVKDGVNFTYYSEAPTCTGEGRQWFGGFYLSSGASIPASSTDSITNSIAVKQNQNANLGAGNPQLTVTNNVGGTNSNLYSNGNFAGNHVFTVRIDSQNVSVYYDNTPIVSNVAHNQPSTLMYVYFYKHADQAILASQRFDNFTATG